MDTLIQQCEELSYGERMKYMYEIGLRSRTDISTRESVAKLLHGSLYEQMLGLQTCYGSRDISSLLQAVASRSRSMRKLSTVIISRLGSDEEVLQMLASIQRHLKPKVLHVLRRHQRQHAIDTFLDHLAKEGSDDDLLMNQISLASEEIVERWLPRVVALFNSEHWTRLARRHPKVVCKAIQQCVEAKDDITHGIYKVLDVVLPEMGRDSIPRSIADTALDLVVFLQGYIPLSALKLQSIVKKRPQKVAELIIKEGKETSLSFQSVSHELQSQELCALFEKYPNTVSQHGFDKFRPEQRLAIYHLAREGWRDRNGLLSWSIVSKLPKTERHAEARRHLKLPYFNIWPAQRIPYISLLPWEESLAMQLPFFQSGEANIRASALCHQIGAALYNEAYLEDALQLLIKRRFEQDPVRQSMLSALANLPPSRWKPEHFSSLARVIRDALDASDLSSAGPLIKLLGKLIPFHATWASSQVIGIFRERGGGFENTRDLRIGAYTRQTARIVAVSLLPYLEILQKQEDDGTILKLAFYFDKNIQFFPELLDTIEDILMSNNVHNLALRAMNILTNHSHHRLKVLIPKMLVADASFMNIESIKSYVHHHQQILLNPFLEQKAIQGRFSTGKSRVPLGLYSGFHMWTQKQQELFAKALLKDLNDNDRTVDDLQGSIDQLATLHFVDPEYLISFSNDERIVIRDRALRALPRLDAGQGVPAMLEALGDARARIAIYSLAGVLKTMSRSESLSLLQSTKTEKVTVAKEVIRLIGELDTEDAYQHLLKASKTELHQDVHIAMLRALWTYLERAETWDIYQEAARHENPNVAKALTNIPVGSSRSMRKSYVTVFIVLLHHPEPQVRLLSLQNSVSLPKEEETEQELLETLLKLLSSILHEEAAAASRALFTRYRATRPLLIAEAIHRIIPDRELLSTVVEPYIQNVSVLGRDEMLDSTQAILAALKTDGISLSLRLRLIFSGLPWQQLKEEILSIGLELHADALVQTEALIAELRWRPDVRLEEMENMLAQHEDEKLRRLGLAVLVVQSVRPVGWTSALRQRLKLYQQDRSILVASAACWIFPPREDDDENKNQRPRSDKRPL